MKVRQGNEAERKALKPAAPRPRPAEDVGDGGERITHLDCNDCYFAHLSIYAFALPFGKGARILDAGSGAGYGTHYLAERGACSVCGIDVSEKAVAFSRDCFSRDNLEYRIGDLQRLGEMGFAPFDLVFSSNVAEHLPDAAAFLRGAWRLTAADGAFVLAVPPITSPELRAANLANLYHLNIWSPRQWHSMLRLYFAEVQCFRHLGAPGCDIDFARPPGQTNVTEEDFLFEPATLEELSSLPTITAVYVARRPLPPERAPAAAAPVAWVDDSFTRAAPVVRRPAFARWRRLLPRSVKRWLRLLLKKPA